MKQVKQVAHTSKFTRRVEVFYVSDDRPLPSKQLL
jgi:hypothetical protein